MSNPLDFNGPSQPNHSAIHITTGVGKSDATRTAAAEYVRKAKKRGIPHRVAIYVPTHRLGEEARQRFPADISTALLQSRKLPIVWIAVTDQSRLDPLLALVCSV
jgi:hypothetical protein